MNERIKALIASGVPGYTQLAPNLYLRISNELTATFLVRYTVHKKRREITLGAVDELTLETATANAREIKLMAKKGIDPQGEKQRHKAQQVISKPYFVYNKGVWWRYESKEQCETGRELKKINALNEHKKISVNVFKPAVHCVGWSSLFE